MAKKYYYEMYHRYGFYDIETKVFSCNNPNLEMHTQDWKNVDESIKKLYADFEFYPFREDQEDVISIRKIKIPHYNYEKDL